MSMPNEPQPVQSITSAPVPLTEDAEGRFTRYAWLMGIRTASVIAFIFIDHWSRWIFLPAGLLLPYVAVVIANAGREGNRTPDTWVATSAAPEVPPVMRPSLPEARAVVDGEIVDRDFVDLDIVGGKIVDGEIVSPRPSEAAATPAAAKSTSPPTPETTTVPTL